MKRRFLAAAALTAAVVVIAAYAVRRHYEDAVARRPSPAVVKVVAVPPGATTRDIARLLAREGLLADENAFVWYCRFHGLDGRLQAGRYRLNSDDGIPGLAAALTKGRVFVHRLTVPEGYDKKKTAAAVARAGICPADDFLAACAAGDPRGRLPSRELEGYLYPDTYEFAAVASAEDVVTAMVDQFFRVMGPKEQARAKEMGRPLADVVTVASIVEREALRRDEKPVVASVFYNRLARGMRLESCATVIYALGRQPERLTVQDLKVDSPYNTYLHAGLPPGPICSPGKDALRAALYPAHTDHLFFVSNGDGTHTFSRTLGEHLRARDAKKQPPKVAAK